MCAEKQLQINITQTATISMDDQKVKAVRYSSETIDDRGNWEYDIEVIYIESLGIALTSDGGLIHSEIPPESKATKRATEEYLAILENKPKDLFTEYQRVVTEAHERDDTPITLDKQLIDKLLALDQEHSVIKEKEREVANRLAGYVKRVFMNQ